LQDLVAAQALVEQVACRVAARSASPDYSRIRVMIAQDLGFTRFFAIEGIAGAIAE
jgi:hypothetical protein